jgi:hypothetical protein
MSDEGKATVAFPFFQILALIFITLKLMGEITWSWWWVLSPIWAPFVIMLVVGFLIALLSLLKGDR